MHHIPPPSPRRAKFCITFVFHFSWVQPSQEKLKTMLTQNFGGQIRCIMEKVEMANSHVTYNRIVFYSVDGKWSEWRDWGECSRSCGGGFHTRSRTCTEPPPRHGGKDCSGKPDETRPCNTQSCPGTTC